MTLKFIPPPQAARYALSIGGSFHIYNDIARAKIAWWNHGRWRTSTSAYILENVEGSWFVLYEIPPNTTEPPWYKDVSTYRSGYGWRDTKRARPMSREEYATWRVQVDRELLAERSLPEIAAVLGLTT